MAQLSVALAMARGFLNDVNGVVWSDANLIPYLQQAHYELQTKLWTHNSPIVRGVTGPLFVPTGASPNINSIIPSDFLIPTHADECGVTGSSTSTCTDLVINASNSSIVSSATLSFVVADVGFLLVITGGAGFTAGTYVIVFVDALGNATLSEPAGTVASTGGSASLTVGTPDNTWIPMTEQFFLTLGIALSPVLTWWAYREETVLLTGSSANRYINFQYRRQIPIPQAATDPIGMIFGELYLGARGPAIASAALGNIASGTALDATATSNFAMVLMANRGQQKPPNQP